MKWNEDNLRNHWDNIKCTNIWVIGVLEKEEKKKYAEKILEYIIVENFPSVENEIVNQVQEVQSPKQDKPKDKHIETHTDQANRN